MKIHWLSWYLHSTILLLSSLSVLFTLIWAKGRSIPPTYKYPTLLFRILKCENNHISSITVSKLFNHILWSCVHFKWMGICWQCKMNLDGSIMKKKSYHFIWIWSHQNIKYICDRQEKTCCILWQNRLDNYSTIWLHVLPWTIILQYTTQVFETV